MNVDLPLLRFMLDSSDIMIRIQLTCIVLSLCFLVFYFFQKISPKYLFGDDDQYAGYIYNAMGVVFSLIFAFITVLVWQSYNNVADSVTKEARFMFKDWILFSFRSTPQTSSSSKGVRSGLTLMHTLIFSALTLAS